MVRKNISSDQSDADAAAKLGEDEEIVLTDTRTIRKNKRKPPEPPLIPKDDDDEGDEFELVGGRSPFREGTVAHKLWERSRNPEAEDEDDALNFDTGNVLVVRKPDTPGETFLKPCVSRMSQPPLRNLDFRDLAETDIEEMVRAHYWGGHYYLQYQIGNSIQTGWACDLADPPEAVRAAKADADAALAIQHQPPTPVAVAEPLSSMERRVAELRLEREYDELKFGEERKRLERLETELAELRAEKNQTPVERRSEKMEMLDIALSASKSEVTDRVLNSIFPSEQGGHWLGDILRGGAELLGVVMENKDEIGGAIGAVASFMGGGSPPAKNDFANLMRAAPPTLPANAPPAGSRFARRQPAAEPPASLGASADIPVTDAEDEAMNEKAAGGKKGTKNAK